MSPLLFISMIYFGSSPHLAFNRFLRDEEPLYNFDGQWTPWAQLGPCLVTCGQGLAMEERQCLGRSGGGLPCTGEESRTVACDTLVTCPGLREFYLAFRPRPILLLVILVFYYYGTSVKKEIQPPSFRYNCKTNVDKRSYK